MRAWVFFGAAVALVSAGGCAPATGPQHVADVRAHEAESAAKLSAEGQVLYAEDVAKRNGYEYCSLAVGLVEQGEFRRAIREASKALYLGAATGDRCLSAFAQRDLAQAYSFAGEIDRAREFADQALRGATSCREPWRVQTVAYKVLGDVLLRQGRPKEAIEQYEKVPEGNVLLGGGAGGGHFVRISLANAYLVGGDPKKELRPILPGDVTLVQYHVTRERTYVWVVQTAGVRTVKIEVGRETLARETERFRKATRQLAPDIPELGAGLYQHLVRPLGLDAGAAVVIVPHGPLHYLPFQALRGPEGYLVERHSISYAPSAASVVYGLSRQGVGRARVLALGNPDLGDPRTALPAAEREVEQIKEYFPDAEIYVRRAATKERLMGRAPESELVHVAAHAEIDEIDPVYSVVKLARSERMPGELEAHEIYGMDLRRTGLVALSACDSGLGRISRGDEVWAFTRSFLVAGARTLVVSLWPVEDQATSRLMGGFYDQLRQRGPRDSLRAAQLQLLRDPQTSHPFFWAAFNVVGDWR